eukprot:SAG22_NODE_6225_length_883_cov_1.647959_2_plen_100_part_01
MGAGTRVQNLADVKPAPDPQKLRGQADFNQFLGTCAGIAVTKGLTYPLHRASLVLQVQGANPVANGMTFSGGGIGVLRDTFAEHGFFGLYRGFGVQAAQN